MQPWRKPIAALAATASLWQGQAQADCDKESQCSFKKPNILLVLDYSSSMRGAEAAPAFFPPGQTLTTRWDAELDAATWILQYRQGFFADNARVALARFAHDPDPLQPATIISTDRSFPPIVDGFALDVPFDGSNGQYLECKSSAVEAAIEVLRTTPPPAIGGTADFNSIMLTWTRGALRSAHDLVKRTREHHRSEPGESARDYEVVLMTDGDWTCPDRVGQGCDENPAPEAALLREAGVPVHVIAFGDATMQPSLNEVALQGGTVNAIDATSPQGIVDAFNSVLDGIRDKVIVPSCTQKLARIMLVMDASSSMLEGAPPGETKWDKARFALTGNPAAPNPNDPGYVEPVLTRKLTVGGREVAVEDVVHLGMVAFGGADEQKLIANFGPCMRDNLAWALDPKTSCEAPGCTDPYASAPLTWTFKDSDVAHKPPFVRRTHSYMPGCGMSSGPLNCQAPTTFTGQGLEFARKVVNDYKANSAPFTTDDQTRFVNVLITDGQTSAGSSDVQKILSQLVSEGIDTYVIGFGGDTEIDRAQLDRYASWGNTQRAIVVDPAQAGSSTALADALSGVVMSLQLDSCCVLQQCATTPEPPDPHSVCGDGRVDPDELCDDGKANATYGHCGGDCKSRHLHCGDQRIDAPQEECDDGNTRSRDGCDARCRFEVSDDDAGTPTGVGSPDAGLVGAAGLARSFAPTATAGTGTRSNPQTAPLLGAGGMGTTQAPAKSDSCGCRLQQQGSAPPKLWLLSGLLGLWTYRRYKRRR